MNQIPILAVSGFKKTGKTLLVEKLVRTLTGKGWRVAVVKHQHVRVEVDRDGTDTYRFYQAGASVMSCDGEAVFVRARLIEPFVLEQELPRLGEGYDLILAEGFKRSELDKIWLLGENETEPDPAAVNIIEVLPWGEDRYERARAVLSKWLKEKHHRKVDFSGEVI
jgi:molybdopterin-guanine dinucleotide biosynthesis protein B